jgi:hypothetical protein
VSTARDSRFTRFGADIIDAFNFKAIEIFCQMVEVASAHAAEADDTEFMRYAHHISPAFS